MDHLHRSYPTHVEPNSARFDGSVIFVTVCTKDRKRILDNPAAHEALVRAWLESDHWIVGRYVLMPDHVHLLCARSRWDAVPLTNWIAYWKSLSSKSWHCQEDRPLWQQQFWDTRIREGKGQEKWEYIANNPVRAGLVLSAGDWPYQGELNPI